MSDKRQNKADAASEYMIFQKMGFISLEEVGEEEAAALFKDKPSTKIRDKKEGKKSESSTKSASMDKFDLDQVKEWDRFSLSLPLLKPLWEAKFLQPTPVQMAVLEETCKSSKKDFLVSAPTGSGKTLAFLLPMLKSISIPPENVDGGTSDQECPVLTAIIIVPTRELAIQIKTELATFSQYMQNFKFVALIGGMSQERQERHLGYNPNIIIGTPGRLAEVLSCDEGLRKRLPSLRYLVLDEADRLVEPGHFKDLNEITSLILNHCHQRQTFLFSATLGSSTRTKVASLKNRLKLKKPITININSRDTSNNDISPTFPSPSQANPETLQQYRLRCLPEDKNIILATLLKSFKVASESGKALVFVNTIKFIKDLAQILQLLGCSAFPLHAQMQQRQRLKNLDRFKSQPGAVLVTTDVAARGLDIPWVETVIHYHIPKDLDTFIHRSGRTARAGRSGTSISLVSPDESSLFNRFTGQARLSVKDHPLEASSLHLDLKKAVLLSQKIQKLDSSAAKQLRQDSWEKRTAESLGVDLDDDHRPSNKKKRLSDEDNNHQQAGQKKIQLEQRRLKAELNSILSNLSNRC